MSERTVSNTVDTFCCCVICGSIERLRLRSTYSMTNILTSIAMEKATAPFLKGIFEHFSEVLNKYRSSRLTVYPLPLICLETLLAANFEFSRLMVVTLYHT